MFLKNFLKSFLLLIVLQSPLYVHKSLNYWLFTYSKGYCIFLLVLLILTTLVSIFIGFISFKYKDAFLKLVFSLAGIAFALFTLEFSLRFTSFNDTFALYHSWGHKKKEIFGMAPRENSNWDYADAHYNTDQFGYRVNLHYPEWHKTKKDIIFTVGGSSVFGYGLEDNQTWSHLLNEKLKETNYLVQNAGSNSYNSLQVLLRTYLELIHFKPKIIVFYQNRNDVRPEAVKNTATLINEDILFSETMTSYLKKSLPNENWIRHTILGNLIHDKLGTILLNTTNKIYPPVVDLNSERVQKANQVNGENYIRNVKTLYLICKSHNIKLILTTFIHNPNGLHPEQSYMITENNKRIREFATSENIPFVDLEKIMLQTTDPKSLFFGDGYHPNHKGAEFIGEHILKLILKF
jgi:lysophospholipase L1-like esterase